MTATALLWPWRLLSQLGMRRSQLLLLAVLSSVVALLMLVPVLYLLQVFDRVMVSYNLLTLVFVSLIALYLLVLMAFFDCMRTRLLQWVVARFDTLRAEHIFSQLAQRFLNPATSSRSQVSQAFADLQETRQFLVSPLILAWFDAPLGIIFCIAVFLLHPLLGYLALGFIAVQLLYALFAHSVLARAGQGQEGQEPVHQQEAHFLAPRLAALDTTHTLGMRPQLLAQWSALREQDNQSALRTQHTSHTLASISKGLRYLQQGLVLGAAAWLVIQGELSLGSMIAANVLVMRVLAPIDQLTAGYKTMASFHAAAQRLLGSASATAPIPTTALRTAASSTPGWHWQGLTVGIGSRPLLKPVSHHAAPGSLTLLQGPSGVGKTLLIKGALGLLPPGWLHGAVHWVHPAQQLPQPKPGTGLSVGYLSQEVDLFTGTIAQNIARMGEPQSDLVLQAATAAGLHSLIVQLPLGYQTPAGHAGQQLPGGIRQRVGLARALYGSPQLLVLDEPDANLDDLGLTALEQALQHAQQQGSTIVLISHRPAWVRAASTVLTLTPP